MLDPSNPFADLVPPATDPGFTGYIPGVPKPKDPDKPQAIPGTKGWFMGPDGRAFRPEGLPPSADDGADDPQKKAISDAINGLGLDELLTGVQRARGAVGTGWATGTWGKLAELKPGGGTARDDFKSYITQIQGGLINEKLQALKDASKTGASGMGALSEKEGERLASAVAAINDQMSPDALENSFLEIERHARTLQAVRDGKDPNDPTIQKQYKIPPLLKDAPPPPGGGGDTPPAISELNDDQKKAYAAFIASHNGKPDAAAVKTFLEGLLGKQVPNADEIAKALAEGRGASTTARDITARQRVDQENKLGLGDAPAETLAVQGATLNLSDEAAGVGNALSNVIMSPLPNVNFDPGGAYRLGRDAERLRIDDARQQLGYGGTAIEFGGALASANPSATLATITPKAAAVAAGKASAVGGALAGYGSGEGLDQSVTGLGVGALTGHVIGRYGPAVIERALPKRFRTPLGMAPDVADAAKAENVDLIRPMVDPGSVSDYGALESNVYSQPIIRGGAGRVRGQIEDRVANLGGGAPLEEGAAGERLQIASNRYITRSRGLANRLFKRAESAGGDTRFVPNKALAQVDDEISQLSGNEGSNAAEIAFLKTVRSDLAKPGGKTVAEIRNIRQSLRGQIGQSNLTLTGAEARSLRVMDAAADDISDKIPAAASAYRRADNFYRERMVMVDDIKRSILGKKGDPLDPQKAFANIKTLASPGANGRRLAAVMRHLEPDERQDIAATVAQSLGRRAADEPFSTALFVSQTRRLSPSARKTIFGPDGAQSIDNLRLLSRKLEEAEKDINRSRSATVLERQGIRTAARAFIAGLAGIGGQAATGSVSGGLAGMAVAGAAMGTSATRRVLSARAMVNPRVSRWMAEAVDASTPQQAKETTRKLSVIIAREPALAHELQPVYDFLENRLALPLAADPDKGPEANNE